MIKYQYAINSDGNIVKICDVVRQANKRTEVYHCICCNNELIPRLGNVRQHHFKHKETVECSSETYLHILGKRLFYDEFMFCLNNEETFSIEIQQSEVCQNYKSELNVVCHLSREFVVYNLLDYFGSALIEKREGSFIPDVMLISKSGKDKVFVEIAVTHSSSSKKTSSGFRIIEFTVENENDLDIIRTHELSSKDAKIKFINFKPIDRSGNLCDSQCRKHFDYFIVTSDGRSVLLQKTLSQISLDLKERGNRIAHHNITAVECEADDSDFHRKYAAKYKYLVARAHKENVQIKNCFLCRYHADKPSTTSFQDADIRNSIYCRHQRINCNSNHASACKYYWPNNKYVDKLYETGERNRRNKALDKLAKK